MISIIMPTLWKGEYYKKMLPLLDSHPLVGEILIINNDVNQTDHETLNKLTKLVLYNANTNLYVNQSWNYGANRSSFDKLCLYSDDVLFDLKVIDDVYSFLTKNNGVTGFAFETISENNIPIDFMDWETPKIVETTLFHYRFGICMFVHKESYIQIPEEYRIYYGDSTLFDGNILNGKKNFRIENYYVMTKMRSSSKNFNDIIELDHQAYKRNNPNEAFVIDFMDDPKNIEHFQ